MRDDDAVTFFQFGPWRVDISVGEIDDGDGPIRLEPRLSRLLQMLADANGEVVSRNALFEGIWPNQVIGDQTLDSAVSRLRRKLGDDPREPRFIGTVPKKGYRLLQAIERVLPSVPPTAKESDRASAVTHSTPSHTAVDVAANRSRRRIALILLVGLVMILAVNWMSRSSPAEGPDSKQPAPATHADTSIAVLPFLNLSDDPDTGYFGDGMAEELLNQLATVPGLRVASRTSSFRFRESRDVVATDTRTIGARLNVRFLVEGSVRRVDDDLRISVQLLDAENGFQLWSQTYERQWQDILSLQQDITHSLVDHLQLQLRLSDTGSSGHAQSAQAYDLYLLGRHYWHQRKPEALKSAATYFRKALGMEPGFALAYAGLADTYLAQVAYAGLTQSEAIALAEPLLAKALALAPGLAEAHVAMANLHILKTEWNEAESELNKSIAQNPNLSMAYMFLGNVYNETGRLDLAYARYRKARELDPLHATILMNLAQTALKLGLFDRAARSLELAQSLVPAHTFLFGLNAHLAIAAGDQARATELIEAVNAAHAPPNALAKSNDLLARGMLNVFLARHQAAIADLRAALAIGGDDALSARYRMQAHTHLSHALAAIHQSEAARSEARQALELGVAAMREFPRDEAVAYELGMAHLALGHRAAALEALTTSLRLGRRDLGWMAHDRRLDALRTDDGLRAVIEPLASSRSQMRAKVLAQYPD